MQNKKSDLSRMSALKSWYFIAGHKVSSFHNALLNFVDSRSFDIHLKRAQKRQIAIPSVHVETSLKKLVSASGLGRHLCDKPKTPSPGQISTILSKQEYLMCQKRKRVTFDQNRLIAASLVVSLLLFGGHRKFTPITNEQACEGLNLPSSSGYPYFTRKSKVQKQLLADSYRLTADQWMYFPTMRGLRLQLQLKDSLTYKPRLIYPYPGVITLLELKYVTPVINYFVNVESPYLTGKIGSQIGSFIRKAGSKHTYNYSTDIKSFDQNMPNELIYAAFSCLRSSFKLTKDQSIEFENLLTYFCSSLLCGRVGKNNIPLPKVKLSGIPSGTGFTNLIGSICHLLILAYHDLEWFNRHTTYVCGDDNLTFSNTRFTKQDLVSVYRVWGLDLSLDDTDINSSVQKVFFLGYHWLLGTRIIDVKLCINRLVYHTSYLRHLDEFERIVSRSASILLNGKNGSSIFKLIFPELTRSLDRGRDFIIDYLPGNVPPSTRAAALSRRVSSVKLSLKEQLAKGYYTR